MLFVYFKMGSRRATQIQGVIVCVLLLFIVYIYPRQDVSTPSPTRLRPNVFQRDQEIIRGTMKTVNRNMTVGQYHQRLLGCASLGSNIIDSYRRHVEETFSRKNAAVSFLPNYKSPCWMPANASMLNQTTQAKGRLRCLPYVYLAGFAKSGTTDLYRRFIQHPFVAPALKKELDWWSWKALGYMTRRIITFEQYLDYFDDASKATEALEVGDYHPLLTVDSSVSTLWELDAWPLYPGNENAWEPQTVAAHWIKSFTPNAKFVVIMRNPTDRLFSHYLFQKSPPGVPLEPKNSSDFHRRVLHGIEIFNNCFAQRGVRECVYDTCLNSMDNPIQTDMNIHVYPVTTLLWDKLTIRGGFYNIFLEELLSVFPREQLIALRFEDYSENTVSSLNEIYRFLDIGELPHFLINQVLSDSVKNQRRKGTLEVGEMWKETRTLLDEFYRPFNKQLSELLLDNRFTWQDD